MKYIQKKEEPSFFIEDTRTLRNNIRNSNNKSEIWGQYRSQKRRNLKEYMLQNEQNYLCCYCEAKIILDDSHIEHIKPKSINYDNLTFDYKNLAVSCSGVCFSQDTTPETCGHKKGNRFNEDMFLNPTTTTEIRKYFTYTEDGHIQASALDTNRANYTKDLLKLNPLSNYTQEARITSLQQFRASIQKHSRIIKKPIKDIALFLLNKENLAFISFLRFKYKDTLKGEET